MESARAEQLRVEQYLPMSDPRGLAQNEDTESMGARTKVIYTYRLATYRRHVMPSRDCALLSRVLTRERA